MKISSFILFFLSTGHMVIAQVGELSGRIINSRSQPIPRATIHILNTNRAAVSDAKGEFIFRKLAPGHYDLQVSSVGYATLNRSIVLKEKAGDVFDLVLPDASVQLEGVIVSAQKKEEFLQKVPLSITALTGGQVKDYRLWNTRELTAVVPNLYASHSGDERNVTAIRGIVTTSYDPAVTTYIDGVNQFSLDTYISGLADVERIEVLRGPQGTLYGRNAMGGVINIITKQPSNKPDIFAEITSGNYKQKRYGAGVRTALVKDRLFIGASGIYQERQGFYQNEFYNTSFDKQHGIIGNFSLKFLPLSAWAIMLNAKIQNNRNHGAFPLVNGVDESFARPFLLSQDAVARMTDNSFNSSLSVTHSGKYLHFSTQTAFQSNYRFYDKPLDGDFSPIDGVSIINNYGKDWNKVKAWTQEFKFSSPSTSVSKLKWTVGSYLFQQDNPVKQAVHFGDDALLVGAPDTNFSIINTTTARSKGVAFFGQVSYAVTARLGIIAGLRYDQEKKSYRVLGQYQKDPDPVPLFDTRPDTSADVTFNAVSPKFGMTYMLSSHTDAFLTYSRGFRTGGLTSLSSDPSQPPLFAFKPEYSDNIELGIKNNFFNNRLQLNVYAFLARVTDAQVPTLVLPDAVTVTRNAGELTSKGIEIEAAATPVKGLQANYNFGYTHARYGRLKLSQNGTEQDLEGKKQIFTPEVTSMLALQYSYEPGRSGKLKLVARTEWIYLGKQYFDLSNNIRQNDHSLLNARLGISWKYLSLTSWARNLADKRYIAYAYDFGAVHLGDPRTYGITLAFNL